MPAKKRRSPLYPRNRRARLDPELFRNPTSEYRGAPFWSWNSKCDIPQLLRQIEQFKQMGFGGFHIHSRTGLASEYLGKEFMHAVRACTEKAAAEGMLAWLYDEDRWPSGSAGGIVTRDHAHRIRHLLWTATPYHDPPPPKRPGDYTTATRTENGRLIARYEVSLKNGRISRYRRLKDSDPASGHARVWYAYIETPPESPWFNFQTYADTLSRATIQRFIETTHERFAKCVGEYFGNVCPAIFADEPQFVKKSQFDRADDTSDLFMPWTDDFAATFKRAYRQDLLDCLPELFWNLKDDAPSPARYRYHDHTAERFAHAFGDTIAAWCAQHGIALTGHMLGEASLTSQTRGVGEVMRAMRSFDMPGIDVLTDNLEFTTAKQAQSLKHQLGREAMVSELYGVTNWDFDFTGHKRQGDWQAALGVTVRVPHLAWQSMAGESKRDYPAAIGYQSPWYREYPLIENHFARVHTVMSRGQPLVRVAVIHPIESLWLHWGPIEHNSAAVRDLEESFRQLPEWLLYGGIDFDYVSEALMTTIPCQDRKIGAMRYDAILLPNLQTIRSTTRKRLAEFAAAGGRVICAGSEPFVIDKLPTKQAARAHRWQFVPWARSAVLDALSPYREIEITGNNGLHSDSILHQIRIDGKRRNVFLCNTDRDRPRNNMQIAICGKWDVTYLDTMTGQTRAMSSSVDGDRTIVRHSFEAAGHLLLTLSPGGKTMTPANPRTGWTEIARLADPVPIALSEPNALLLDQAMWRIDGRDWQPLEEILRLDNLVREELNLPPRGGRIAQPWADSAPAPVLAQLQLKFAIRSDVDVASPTLAIEDAESVQIHLNRQPVAASIAGWWVDESIKTVALPPIAPGTHELVLTIQFTRKTNVEWCYLLGDFGVSVAGRWAKLVAPVRQLSFGDWTHQGLPFYAGNVTYQCAIDGAGREIAIEVAKFKNPFLSVNLSGHPAGKIAFPPYELNLGKVSEGSHKLDITAFGNRINAFGAIHNADASLKWFGPAAWRSTGPSWSYEYELKPMGILVAPIVKVPTSSI